MRKSTLRRVLAWSTLMTTALFAIIGAPFLLRWLAPAGMDWSELSDISQTYAVISVPLSALALVGAVASLIYQARQARVSQEEAASTVHRELLSRALDDPDLSMCWGPLTSQQITSARTKQFTYINMIISFWHSDYILTGWRADDEALRFLAGKLFNGEVGREFWALFADDWRIGLADARRSRRFLDILDEAHERAVASGPAVSASDFYQPNQPS